MSCFKALVSAQKNYIWFTKSMPAKNGTDSKKSLLQNQFGMPLNGF